MIPPYQGPEVNRLVNIELGNSEIYQLYNLKEDIKQQKNLAKTNPKKLKELVTDFETIRGKENTNIEQLELKWIIKELCNQLLDLGFIFH